MMAHKLFNSFKSSDAIQGLLAIMLGGTICYCVVIARDPPTVLVGAFMAILGYYFRTNNHNQRGA